MLMLINLTRAEYTELLDSVVANIFTEIEAVKNLSLNIRLDRESKRISFMYIDQCIRLHDKLAKQLGVATIDELDSVVTELRRIGYKN